MCTTNVTVEIKNTCLEIKKEGQLILNQGSVLKKDDIGMCLKKDYQAKKWTNIGKNMISMGSILGMHEWFNICIILYHTNRIKDNHIILIDAEKAIWYNILS